MTHVKDQLPVFLPGDPVRMAPFPGSKKRQHATVDSRHQSPRSYVIEHNGRKYRRNRRHLRLSTIGADTRLAAVTQPGQSSESNARRTGIALNEQRPKPVRSVRSVNKHRRLWSRVQEDHKRHRRVQVHPLIIQCLPRGL